MVSVAAVAVAAVVAVAVVCGGVQWYAVASSVAASVFEVVFVVAMA